MEIIWTDKSVLDLEQIFIFLSAKSVAAAQKEIERIYLKISLLEKGFTKIGQQELLLKGNKKEYRYLVSGNYKIIYSRTVTGIYIQTIFDTRQNPKKLRLKE